MWGESEVVEGHGRLLAVMEMPEITTVPIIRLDHLNDEQKRAYALIHNKLTMNSDFDMDLLFEELEAIDLDMRLYGFDVDTNIVIPFEEHKEVEEDDYEIDVPILPKTQFGNIWQLGEHILICGDSTEHKTFEILMENEKISPLLFTSPPYSDMRDYNGDKDVAVEKISQFISATADYVEYMVVNLGIQRKDKEIYPYWDEYIKTAHNNDLKLLGWNVWDKLTCGSIGMYKALVPIRHEWLFVFGRDYKDLNLTWEKKKSNIYANGRRQKRRQKDGSFKESSMGITSNAFKKLESVIKLPDKETLDSVTEQFCENSSEVCSQHPAAFPVYLPAEYILAFTDEGDTVIEPFGGSGTTLITCEQLGRKCRCVELDEGYCDVIIDRWEKFTGKKAVLLNG